MKLSELIKNIDSLEKELSEYNGLCAFHFYFPDYVISHESSFIQEYRIKMINSGLNLSLCRFYEPSGMSSVCRDKEELLKAGFIDDLECDLECDMEDDAVNSPSHYTQGKVEYIDAIESACINKQGIEAVCVANVIKYLWRYENKNGVEDVRKARWYLERLIKVLELKE